MGVVALDRPYIYLSLRMMLSKSESPLPFLKKNLKNQIFLNPTVRNRRGWGGGSLQKICIYNPYSKKKDGEVISFLLFF